MLLVLLLACEPQANPPGADDDRGGKDSGTDGTDTGSDDTAGQEVATWQFLVFMNGDNDLEDYVAHDLNELELSGSGEGVEVLVQADRIEGYSTKDGDWTGARRYRIVGDDNDKKVSSPVVQDLGEIDMGSPVVLAEFLEWAATNYPAENRVLIMWNHGDSWTANATEGATPPPGISYDDTDGGYLSFAEGTFAEAVEASVDAHGRFDVVGFDACNMASWEVAHAIAPYGDALSAAETTIGWEGFQYGPFLDWLKANIDAPGTEVAAELSRGAVEVGEEPTHSATDLTRIAEVSAALDALAGAALDDDELRSTLFQVRGQTEGADTTYKNYYLDLGDFASNLAASGHPTLAPLGATLDAAVSESVVASHAQADYAWARGLTFYFDPRDDEYLELYVNGAGATWSQDTRWDDLMVEMSY